MFSDLGAERATAQSSLVTDTENNRSCSAKCGCLHVDPRSFVMHAKYTHGVAKVAFVSVSIQSCLLSSLFEHTGLVVLLTLTLNRRGTT